MPAACLTHGRPAPKVARGTALAAAAPAQAADVVSSNIVGYQKVALSAGLNMIGVQFTDVGSTDAAVTSFATLDSTMEGFDEDLNFANTMMVWNGNGYTTYGWAGKSPSAMDAEYAEMDDTWLTLGLEPTDDTHPVYGGFWVDAKTAGTITLSGEVLNEGTKTVSLAAGLNMLANPFPSTVNISTFGVLDSTMEGFDEDLNFQTTMMVWNGNGYTTYGWAGTSPSHFGASINWGTTSAATFDGTKMGGVNATLIHLGATDLSGSATFTITESTTLSSLANEIGTDTGSTTTSTASGMGKGKVAGTWTFDSGLTSGDYVAILLSYTAEGTTWYNLTSTTTVSYNEVAGVWNNSSNAANWSYSGGTAADSKTGTIKAGGGWVAVPEPSTAALALAGLALLLKRRKA